MNTSPQEEAVKKTTHTSHHSSSKHRSSGSGQSSHHSSGREHTSAHHTSGSGHSSSRHSSGSEHSSSHHTSDAEQSSSHHASSRSSARHDAEREHREALIGKYQVVSQDDIVPEEAHTHHHHHRHHRRRRRTVRRVLIAVASVLLSIVLIAGGAFAVLHQLGKKQIQAEPVGVQDNPYSVSYDEGNTVEYNGGTYELNRNLVTIAAIGVDRETFGLKYDKIGTAGQADMILLLTMDLDTGATRGLMIPRDTMVDVDLYTVDGQYVGVDNMQICLSFAYGDGEQTSAQNVLTSAGRVLYGIPLQMYGAMDLAGIAALNDAVGGVTVTLQETYNGAAAGQRLTLHGQEAHAFVRSRDTEALNSDAPRRARQIQYLYAFIDKVYSAAKNDIGTVRRLYNVAMQYAFTNISLAKVTYLATTLLSKGAVMGEITTLQGELKDADPYPEYHLDEQAAFETVLDIFYTRVN